MILYCPKYHNKKLDIMSNTKTAYASSETDPFEYTYNGKILTKPYVQEIDRLLRNGYHEKDECVLKLIIKLTFIINPNATELLPMRSINYYRHLLRENELLHKYLFQKQEKEKIELILRLIPVYKKMDKELTAKMKIIEKAIDENGVFNIDLVNYDEYYSNQYYNED